VPVRQMTEEESERIFGSGFVIFGMKRPTGSNNPQARGDTHGDSSGISGLEAGGKGPMLQGIHYPIPSPER